jgi:hypothetical protein
MKPGVSRILAQPKQAIMPATPNKVHVSTRTNYFAGNLNLIHEKLYFIRFSL